MTTSSLFRFVCVICFPGQSGCVRADDLTLPGQARNGSKKMEEGAGAKTAMRQPCILTFDSLSSGSKASTHQTLREYLSFEWKNKMVPSGAEEKVFTKETIVDH